MVDQTANTRTSTSSPDNIDSSPRRSSTSNDRFSKLMEQKRSTANPDMNVKRALWADQAPRRGVLGTWWHEFTRGGARA